MGIRGALIITTANRYVSMVVNFATIAITARLLTPAEFGVSAIGIAITSIAVALSEFAPQTYLIQKPGLTRTDIRATFTMMMLAAASIAALIIAAAPWLEEFYRQEGLTPYLGLIALTLLFEPFHTTIAGILRREMQFVKASLVSMANVLGNSAALIWFASNDFSFMSFGWGWLAASLASCAVAFACRPDLSIFVPTRHALRPLLVFGGYNGAASVLFRVYEAVPFLAFARILPMQALGLLNRMFTTMQIPDKFMLAGVMSVALPALSQIGREGGNLKSAYLNAITHVTALQWPALAMMAILAYPITDLLLGPQWEAVAPLLQIAAIAWMFNFSYQIDYPVMVACNAMRANLLRAAITWPVSAALLIGAGFFGATAVAASLLVIIPLQAFSSLWFVRRELNLGFLELIAALRQSLVATLGAVAGPLVWVAARGGFEMSLFEAIGMSAACGAGWLAGLWMSAHPMWGELNRALSTAASRWSLRGS